MTILVIDDNTTLLSKIVRSLVLAEYQVRSASTIRQARHALAEMSPLVVCLDLQLPDGNGLDLLEEIRRSGNRIPVIIISGQRSPEEYERAKRLGVSGFLTKPFALSDLHDLLSSLLRDSSPDGGGYLSGEGEGCSTAEWEASEPLDPSRIRRAKWAYTTHRVDCSDASRLITRDYRPRSGDLVLARVDRLSQHRRIELVNGRRATLYAEDEIVVCYGNRYAPDQFEAEIPEDLSPCHLVAAGGIASRCLSRNTKMRSATRITPLGILADADGRPLNLSRYALEPRLSDKRRPGVTAVIGTSMNAGKTTTLAGLTLGLTRQGVRVGTAKVTGTGAGCDIWQMVDAGSGAVLDFTDCGLPSTYQLPIEVCEAALETLVAHLSTRNVDQILIEIADGILQEETRALIKSAKFSRLVDQVVFAAADPLGAHGGISWLRKQGVRVVGVSGAMTCAPLSMQECAGLIDLPIVDQQTLIDGRWQLDHLVSARGRDTQVA